MRVHPAGDVADRDADPARAGRMPGDPRHAALRLNQQVVGLHVAVGVAAAVAADIDGDQPLVARPQLRRVEARAGGGTGGEVLHEHVRLGQDGVQQAGVFGILDVGDEALLAAVQPDEVACKTVDGGVVASREIPFRPLDLDDPGPGIGQPRGAVGRGDGLLQGEHGQTLQRPIPVHPGLSITRRPEGPV